MVRTSRRCRVLLLGCLGVLGPATATLSAGPVISFDPQTGGIRLVQKGDLDGKTTSRFVVKATGSAAVSRAYATVTGVLFQATARPADALRSQPIRLSYRLQGEHDAVLNVAIGTHKATSDAPAWVWAVAARFASHEATGAVTLIDGPSTPTERKFERRWRAGNVPGKRLLWARYHPALDDTLMGFFLMTADAFIGDPEHVRTLPSGLKHFQKYSRYPPTLDRARSRPAARALDAIISLKAKPGDRAMLNDVDERFVFAIAGGHLQISGVPNYRFARKGRAGAFREITDLTEVCRKNRRLIRNANPLLERTVADFARLAAFFRYVGRSNPDAFHAFVKNLTPVLERIPTIKTPIAVPLRAR